MKNAKLKPERTCDKHPGRAAFRVIKNDAMCAECFNGLPVTVKPRDFELITEEQFPGAPERGLLLRALHELKAAAPGMAVKIPANGRACERVAKALHQTAKRLGFKIETRSDRGLWVYVRRRRKAVSAPIEIRKARRA
jgi:hypothetical protein